MFLRESILNRRNVMISVITDVYAGLLILDFTFFIPSTKFYKFGVNESV